MEYMNDNEQMTQGRTAPIYQLSLRGMRVEGGYESDEANETPAAIERIHRLTQTAYDTLGHISLLRLSSCTTSLPVLEMFCSRVLRRLEVYGNDSTVDLLFAHMFPDVWRQFPRTSIDFSTHQGTLFSC